MLGIKFLSVFGITPRIVINYYPVHGMIQRDIRFQALGSTVAHSKSGKNINRKYRFCICAAGAIVLDKVVPSVPQKVVDSRVRW